MTARSGNPANRPKLARKVTPTSEKERKEALDQGVCVTYDGTKYTVRMGDLSSLDTMALRREVGLSWLGLLRALNTDPDLDLFAAVVWLSRRSKGEQGLPYAAVAAEITYDSDLDMDEADASADETDPNSPEA